MGMGGGEVGAGCSGGKTAHQRSPVRVDIASASVIGQGSPGEELTLDSCVCWLES